MTSLIAAFAWRTGLAKEAIGTNEQKKQFQRTGLNTVEVMNDIFSIENRKICSINIHRYHFQTKWVEYIRSYIFYQRDNIGIPGPAFASEASSDCAKFCCVVSA